MCLSAKSISGADLAGLCMGESELNIERDTTHSLQRFVLRSSMHSHNWAESANRNGFSTAQIPFVSADRSSMKP